MDIETPTTDAAPEPSSEPVSSTNDIAAEVYDDSADESPETLAAPADTQEPPPAPAPVTEAEISEAERLLIKAGFKDARRPDGREWRIPRSKVITTLERALKEARAELDGKYAPVTQERDRYKADLDELVAEARGEDTKRFLEKLAEFNPGFRSYLQPVPQAQPQAAADDPEPEPDIDLGDGRRTYSLAGLKKRDEWRDRRLMAQFDERLKPLTESQKQAQERQEREAYLSQTRESARRQMTEAESWPGFGKIAPDGTYTEFQTEVLKVLQEDSAKAAAEKRRPTMSLRQAYLEVQAKRLAITDTERREAILKEVNAAPKSTAVPRGGEAPSARGMKQSIRDIAASVLDSGA